MINFILAQVVLMENIQLLNLNKEVLLRFVKIVHMKKQLCVKAL